MNRGRGRGRKSAGPRPVARNDEGQIVETKPQEGPPPLFPERELPNISLEELSAADRLIKIYNSIGSSWKKTFRLELSSDTQTSKATKPSIDQRAASNQAIALMSLDTKSFPEELHPLSRTRPRSEAAYWASRKRARLAEDVNLAKFDELAAREQGDRPTPLLPRPGGVLRDDDDEGEEGEEEEEEGVGGEAHDGQMEYDQDEEDDYDAAYEDAYQGYDDDEGYDDGFEDGGGDEGPFF